ncbi:von willebrand factor A domain protein [Trema orientale]|uniref:von willebrand factor A domain protein n=1 Tax=Trema orientale TaxID=63057 RepID=A0A2P5EIF7_TREOI|nr:von willebrand factor A domain protein [Trema orientale]
MDGRGGCCIARYAAGGAVYGYDMSKVGRIMLRFRPIAPKPVAGGSVSGAGASKVENGENQVRGGRGKRRLVRENNNNNSNKRNNNKRCNSKKRKASSPDETSYDKKRRRFAAEEKVVTTLPLLPETPEPKDTPARISSPKWLSFEGFVSSTKNNIVNNKNDKKTGQDNIYGGGRSADPLAAMMPRPVRLAGSSVTVECVTDTWTDGINKYGWLGRTDEERRMSLERDTCPGFVSDGYGRVTWTNEAYRKMVAQWCGVHDGCCGGGGDDQERDGQMMMMVWLVMKEKLPVATMLTCPAFTCRVRLQCYTDGNKEVKSSLTLPCDVWRMDSGGFAWRLDVNAALCLGR